jgi:hypothetical protein
MLFARWRSRLLLAGMVFMAVLGSVSNVLAQTSVPPPPPPPPNLVPATGAALVIGGLLGYGIYRLRKRK